MAQELESNDPSIDQSAVAILTAEANRRAEEDAALLTSTVGEAS